MTEPSRLRNMRCSSCGASVKAGAWICPACDHILDPSVLEPELLRSAPSGSVQSIREDSGNLGEVGIVESEFAPPSEAGTVVGSRSSSFLFYASGDMSRVVRRDAVPRWTRGAPPAPGGPHGFLLSCVDGVRTVRQIERATRLPPQKVVVSLLAMLDRGLLDIRTRDGAPGASPASRAGPPAAGPYSVEEVSPLDEDDLDDVWSDDVQDDDTPALPFARTEPPSQPSPAKGLPSIASSSSPAGGLPPIGSSPPSTGFAPLPPVQPTDLGPEDGEDSPPVPAVTIRPHPHQEEPAPLLDPAFLEEVPDTPPPKISAQPKPDAPSTSSTPSSGRRPLATQDLPASVRERVHQSRKKQVAQASRAAPVDSVRMMKAQKLFEQALRDKAEGNLISARMNMKLALTFDPGNELYAEASEELDKSGSSQVGHRPPGKSRARELYDKATEAENMGEFDQAIEFLEKALNESKQPAFYNRLGVLLATRRHEYTRAQQLVEKAIELSPGIVVYEKNLQKILARAATHDVNMRTSGDEKKGGLLGFLGRRK